MSVSEDGLAHKKDCEGKKLFPNKMSAAEFRQKYYDDPDKVYTLKELRDQMKTPEELRKENKIILK